MERRLHLRIGTHEYAAFGEKALLIDAAIEEGLPVIHLQKKPIERYWKPERRRFEACARGALLILAPWGLDEEIMKTDATATEAPSDYARFHRLNDLAEEICNTTDVTLLNMTGIAWRCQGPVPCQAET